MGSNPIGPTTALAALDAAATAWPVIADERLRGRRITLGAGQHGLAVAVAADEVLQALDAIVADVSDPDPEPVPSTRR